jgi:hypothetical protein
MLRAAGSDTRCGPLAETDNRVETLTIIEDLDVPRNIFLGLLARRVGGAMDSFILQGTEE